MQASGAMPVNLPRSDEATSDLLVAGSRSGFVALSALPPIESSRDFGLKFRTRLARPLHRPGGQIDGN
jgi:hypothetical protein